jgi:hypothetical protein
MTKGYFRKKNEERQKRASLTDAEKTEREILNNLDDKRLLKAVKAVMSTENGELFVKWILHQTKLFGDTFTNSGMTAFNLGKQGIGKMIVKKLIESGCELRITDLTNDIDSNKLSDIEHKLSLLKQKEGGKK